MFVCKGRSLRGSGHGGPVWDWVHGGGGGQGSEVSGEGIEREVALPTGAEPQDRSQASDCRPL